VNGVYIDWSPIEMTLDESNNGWVVTDEEIGSLGIFIF
jgi:hypothetical protein